MDVILLERIRGLGGIGDEARVRDGYARNFLLPQGKALRSNAANRAHFEADRAEIEAKNATELEKAEKRREALDGAFLVIIRQSGDTGRLYGSVTVRDISTAANDAGHELDRREISLDNPIKTIGLHRVTLHLHPEVSVSVWANIARSADEAERQAAGENVIEQAMRERGRPVVSHEDVDDAAEDAGEEADASDTSDADAAEDAGEEADTSDADAADEADDASPEPPLSTETEEDKEDEASQNA